MCKKTKTRQTERQKGDCFLQMRREIPFEKKREASPLSVNPFVLITGN